MLIEVAQWYQVVKILNDIIKLDYIAQVLQWFEPKGHLHVP